MEADGFVNVVWFGQQHTKKIRTNNAKALTVMGAGAVSVVKPLVPVDTGLLKSSVTYATALERGRPTAEGNETRRTASDKELIEQPDDMHKLKVGTAVEYAPHVEFGTKKHFPPIAPLASWAKRVLKNEKLGFVVARAISRHGTKAQSFLRQGIFSHKKELGKLYSKTLKGLLGY